MRYPSSILGRQKTFTRSVFCLHRVSLKLNMTEDQKLEIFQAQTANVREIEKAWSHVNRAINFDIVKNNTPGLKFNTKILCITYCALAEAAFSKIIHTPYGLAIAQIEQIKATTTQFGVKEGWLKAVELAMQNVKSSKSNHGHNVKQKLNSLINQYIFDPSIIRNKIAHGQWVQALNRDNTCINAEITREINQITIVDLYRRKHALDKLAAILEDIIESPNKAHHRDYWPHLVKLEQVLDEMSHWTLEKKIKSVKEKYARPKKT